MSGLRQTSKRADANAIPEAEEDIEAPKEEVSSPSFNSKASSAPSPSSSSHNPVVIARIVLHKVFALLISSDEEDLTRPDGIITLLKDVIVGVLLGVITISALILMDHHGIVHFQSAHNFRNAAFQLVNDPETLATLEESSDLKFMTTSEYESMRKEIDAVAEKVANNGAVLEKRTKEAEEKRKEVEAIREEYDKLMASPLLGLDKFCGTCSWTGGTSCAKRLQFLQDNYGTRPIQAKISTMGHESCISK